LKEGVSMPTVTLEIPDTAFVSSAQPTGNFSLYPTMYVGTDASYATCIGLLQIALPTLPVSQVDSAVLQLSVIVKSGASPSPVAVNRVTEPFDPSTVTYDTRPSYTATGSQVNVTTGDLYSAVQIDVTGLVNNWLNGTYPNNGIALTNSDGTTAVQFATNVIVYEPYFPKLVLTYSSSPSESTAICFSYAQLAHVIQQLITLYPTSIIKAYTTGFNAAGIQGTPVELFSSPQATYGTLFVLEDSGEYGAVPLNTITAIELPSGTVYDPSISFLPEPTFPAGCDKNLITAYQAYLPVSTSVTIYSGALISATGIVYKNEAGLVVLATDETGLDPIFIPVVNITAVVTGKPSSDSKEADSSSLIIKGKI
jgi:hypothetical protein